MDRVIAKVLSICLLFICLLVSALLPIKLDRWVNQKGEAGLLVISVLTCFGGGVFLGAYLMHLHPKARDVLEEAWLDEAGIAFPIPELVIAVGFFLVLFTEYAIIWYSERRHIGVPVGHSQIVKSTMSLNDDDVPEEKKEFIVPRVELSPPSVNGTETKLEISHEANVAQGRSVVLIIALSLDCVFEGMALGLQKDDTGVFSMFVAIISHEIIMAFCLGLELVKHYSRRKVVLGAICYALTIPVGIAIGILIMEIEHEESQNVDIANGVLQCIAGGCFVYVAFFGILTEEIRKKSTLSKLFAVLLGFTLMTCMRFIPMPEEPINGILAMTTISNEQNS